MKQLFIIIKEKYFDQIINGDKKEEYRLITPYWENRLSKEYDTILFQVGYSKEKRAEVEFLGIQTKKITHEHFNNEPIEVFALRLGEILNTSNL